MRDKFTRAIALCVATISLVACGGDSPTSPASASIAGTYQLKTINGSALPFTYQSGLNKIVITSDVITVAEGGTWTETGHFTLSYNGQTTDQVIADGGTWTRAGTDVSFYSVQQGEVSYSGTFTGGGFSLSDAAFTYSFGH
jgi:hypothetical protein